MNTIDFQSLFASIPGFYLVLSPDFTIIAGSDAYIHAIASTRDALLDRNFFDVFPESAQDASAGERYSLKASFSHALHNRTPHTIAARKYDMYTLNEALAGKFLIITNKPVVNSQEEVLYIIHSIEVVHDLKEAEAMLEIGQASFRSSMENLTDVGILSVDRQYTITDCNSNLREKMLRVYGTEIEVGKNLLHCITNDEHRQKVQNDCDRAFSGESHTAIEEFGEENTLCYETRFNPIFNDRREIIGAISFSVNITERKKADNKLQEQQILLQSIIESNKDILIFSIDTEYRYLNFNATFRVSTSYAYGTEVEVGMNLFDSITNENDRKRIKNNCERALAGESHITVEEYGDLEREYYETRYNPIFKDNTIIGVTVLSTNITRRKRAEQEIQKLNEELEQRATLLEKSNKLFSDLFYHNPAAVAISRLGDGRILDINESFLALFGFPAREDVIGKTAEELHIFVEHDQRDRLLRMIREYKRIFNVENRFRTVHGDIKWTSSSIQQVEIGGNPCLLAVHIDITQRKKQEELLKVQSKNLEQANAELETFSYSVSHDLKAPLRSLEGFSKALLETYRGKLDADADRWLYFIADNAHRMGILINDILNFSRVSRSTITTDMVSMKALAEKAFNSEKNHYPDKSITFDLDAIPDVSGDIAMLGQVWQNLISNALKYSSKNETIHITVTGRIEDNFHIYSVKDNGIGFDEKYRDKLFGVFQRLHAHSEFEGTGVGLAIVNRIIQKHNGWITAHSEKGKGSEFIFAIPIIKE